MSEQPGNLARALEAAEKGYSPIPVLPGTKIPAVKWKPWQEIIPPVELIREWFSVRRNLAIVTKGLVVFDCDDPAKVELVIAECGDTPHKVRTPRGGMHLGFRRRKGSVLSNQVNIKGMALDLRTDGGLEMIPESETADGVYEWIGGLGAGLKRKSELPVACIGWTRTRQRTKTRQVVEFGALPESRSRIRNPEHYCMRIESVMGRNGSARLVRVICVMRDAGRTPEQTWAFLLSWNERKAIPPWSEKELRHALRRHYHL